MDNIKNTNLIPPSPEIDVNTLRPFTRFCCSIGAIPSSYLLSMTYEEQLMWLCDYLINTVIPTVNNNGGAVAELQGLYIQLKNYVDNYFTNLDVQEEINNKLDSLAEDGTLTKLIGNYVDPYIEQQNQHIDNIEENLNNSITQQNNYIDEIEENLNNSITQQNNSIQNINNKVNTVASGTPIAVSSIEEMTNTSKTYVNTTDGNWYYYNGSSWVIGGVYQATGISDLSIGPIKTNFAKLFNPFNFEDLIDGQPSEETINDTLGGSHNFYCFNAINISGFNYIVCLRKSYIYKTYFYFYDINGDFISKSGVSDKKSITAFPKNAYYIRPAVYQADFNNENTDIYLCLTVENQYPNIEYDYNDVDINDGNLKEINNKINLNTSNIDKILSGLNKHYTEQKIDWIDGYYITNNGSQFSNKDYSCTNFIPVIPGTHIKIHGSCQYGSIIIAFYDFFKILLNTYPDSSHNSHSNINVETFEMQIPDNCYFIKLCKVNSSGTRYFIFNKPDFSKIDLNSSNIDKILSGLNKHYTEQEIDWIDGGYINLKGNVISENNFSYTDFISVTPSNYIKIKGGNGYAGVMIAFYDFYNSLLNTYPTSSSSGMYQKTVEMQIPDNCYFIRLSKSNNYDYHYYNFDKVDETNNLLKGNLLFFGDSICYGAGYTGGYAKIIGELNPQAKIINKGVGGYTITQREGENNSILETLENNLNQEADYIIVEGGVNDSYHANDTCPLGEMTQDYTDNFNVNTFSGALEKIFYLAQTNEKWYGKKICYIVTFKVPSALSKEGQTFFNYMKRAKEICEKWSIPYLDLFNTSNLNYYLDNHVTQYSTGDGLHPNENGYRLFTPQINNFLKTL